ncbi:MAG: hypothetical protein NXI09_15775 [Bacteroidetes bacterium]|nr:hypothetical protein [Bacteroidota bacterium]
MKFAITPTNSRFRHILIALVVSFNLARGQAIEYIYDFYSIRLDTNGNYEMSNTARNSRFPKFLVYGSYVSNNDTILFTQDTYCQVVSVDSVVLGDEENVSSSYVYYRLKGASDCDKYYISNSWKLVSRNGYEIDTTYTAKTSVNDQGPFNLQLELENGVFLFFNKGSFLLEDLKLSTMNFKIYCAIEYKAIGEYPIGDFKAIQRNEELLVLSGLFGDMNFQLNDKF